ncbi:MAG: photosystem I reaction center subunit XII [Leptolyngbya sp. RL_3_1]|nr:photosystem I reaction center subunit XII [Leptolyngbya sp. RL_3_1]
MLGQWTTSRTTGVDDRIFIYEVTGLATNGTNTNDLSPIRNSHSQFIQVPFSRMGEVMKNIDRLGGNIVAIRPLKAPES